MQQVTEGLQDDAAQFFKNRRLRIGLVVFLVADLLVRQQPGDGEFFQFPLDSSDSDPSETDNLLEVIALIGKSRPSV